MVLDRAEKAEARAARLEQALRWYADEANWYPGVGLAKGCPCAVERDNGERARAALTGHATPHKDGND